MKSVQMAAALVVVAVLGACGGSGGTIPSVTGPTAQPVVPVVPRGQIAITAVAPPSGATLTFRDCRLPESGFSDVCTRDWELAADVQFNRDIDGLLVATFYAGSRLCGFALSPPMPLADDSRRSFTMSYVTLSDEINPTMCPLPVTITRVVLGFYEQGRPAQALLTEELDASYIFSMPRTVD